MSFTIEYIVNQKLLILLQKKLNFTKISYLKNHRIHYCYYIFEKYCSNLLPNLYWKLLKYYFANFSALSNDASIFSQIFSAPIFSTKPAFSIA